jgi:hypothetical protein
MILLPQPPECWDCRCEPPHPAYFSILQCWEWNPGLCIHTKQVFTTKLYPQPLVLFFFFFSVLGLELRATP